LYGDVTKAEESKALSNIPKELTVRDRKYYELTVKSGTTGN
jgi:hypothetical protein